MSAGPISSEKIDLLIYGPLRPILANHVAVVVPGLEAPCPRVAPAR